MFTPRCEFSSMAFALALCGGCAEYDRGESLASGINRAREPVIVTLGGFNSCVSTSAGPTPVGSVRWNRSARLSDRFSRGDSQWVRGCIDRSSRLYWVSSAAPATVRSTALDALAPFFGEVAERVGHEGRPLYALGHSYGAWVAMYAVWSLPRSANVRLLFTVDPISPAHCTAASYLRALASPVSAPWELAGCQRAPSDFTPGARRWIVSRMPEGAWRHYYQRNFLPLRSNAFVAAPGPHHSYDVSSFLTLNGGAHPSWNAHIGIAELSLVWYSFEASIERDLTGE